MLRTPTIRPFIRISRSFAPLLGSCRGMSQGHSSTTVQAQPESKTTFQSCYHFSLSASHDTDLTECLSALLRDKGRNPLPPYSEFYLLHIILLLSAPLRSHVQLHFFYPSQLRIPSREFSVKSPAVYSFRLSVFMIFKSVAHPNLIVKPRHYLYISYTYPGNIMTVFLY